MNADEIRDSSASQWSFWAIAAPTSLVIIVFASFFACRGSIEHWYRNIPTEQPLVQKQEEIFELKEV